MQQYFIDEKVNEKVRFNDEQAHHIKNVMRNKVGDKIECIYDKTLYICEIIDLNSNKVKIIEQKEDDNESKLEVAIAIALVKEQKMDLILQKLTELGVSNIIPVKTERSIVKLDKSKEEKTDKRFFEFLKGYSVDIKDSFNFIKRSNRMKSYLMFAALFYATIKVMSTYKNDLLVDLEIFDYMIYL